MRAIAKASLLVAAFACRGPVAAPGSENSAPHAIVRRTTDAPPLDRTGSVAPPASITSSQPAKQIRFESRGLSLLLGPDEISVIRGGALEPLLSLRAFETARFQQDFPNAGQNYPQCCARRVTATPIAWTGQLLSVRVLEETGCKLEAHPAAEARFITWLVDATDRQRARVASLSEWYLDPELRAALSRDPLVRRAVPAEHRGSLDDLLQSLADAAPVASDGSCYQFPNNLLERFVPSHLDGSSLSIGLSLPGAAVCRHELTELRISLPLPEKYRAALEDGSLGHDGFLARNAPAVIAQHPAIIELGPIPFEEAHPDGLGSLSATIRAQRACAKSAE